MSKRKPKSTAKASRKEKPALPILSDREIADRLLCWRNNTERQPSHYLGLAVIESLALSDKRKPCRVMCRGEGDDGLCSVLAALGYRVVAEVRPKSIVEYRHATLSVVIYDPQADLWITRQMLTIKFKRGGSAAKDLQKYFAEGLQHAVVRR